MKMNSIVDLFRGLWELYGKSIESSNFKIIDNDELTDEFFFIILGGFGISYELNKSGLNIIKSKGLTSSHLYADNMLEDTTLSIRKEFSTSQFEPRTKNNQLRKYRFIESKPSRIAFGGNWLLKECDWDLSNWLNINGINSRNALCNCPGIGMKSASWFLRNIGYNDDYAVFDIHLLRFMDKIGIDVPNVITEKVYIRLEKTLRDVCNHINVTLGEMDYLLWILARNGYLDYVRCS